MSLTPQIITLDLNPSFTQMQTVHCSQYDDNIRQIQVKLQDGGTDIDVSSYTIYIEGTKPDKHGFSYPLTEIGSVSSNTVTFYIQLQMCAVPGMTRAEVVLKSGDNRIGSANFMIAVERAGLQDDTDISETDIPAYIDGAQQAAAEAAQSARKAQALAIHVTAGPSNPLSIADGADGVPVNDLTVSIQPNQPNAYGSVWVGGAGKNKLAPWITSQTNNGVKYVANADGTFSTSQTATANSQILSPRFKLPVGTYYLSGCPVGGSSSKFFLRALIYNGSTLADSATDTGSGVTFNVADANYEVVIFSAIQNGQTVSATWKPQIESGSSRTAYEPYSNICPISGWTEAAIQRTGNTSTTYTVNWQSEAGTVCGGTLDVTTGLLTVTHLLLDLGSLTWEKWPNLTNIFRCALPSYIKTVDNSTVPNWKCEIYTIREGTAISSTNYTIGQIHQSYLLTHDSRYNDAAAYKTAMNGKHLCYELATPVTYHLTPTEVTTLLNNNTFTANCGDITMTYCADPKTYIANAGGSSWDAVIRLTHANNSGPDDYTNLTLSIVSGTYSDLYGKISNGECPQVLVEYYHPLWEYAYAVPMAYLSINNGTIYVMLAGFSVIDETFKQYGMALWDNTDTISWDA